MTFMLTVLAGASLASGAAPQGSSDYLPSEARKVLYEYGQCIVHRHHAEAAEAVLHDIDSEDLKSRHPDLINGDCLPWDSEIPGADLQVKFVGDQYLYALADALFRSDLADAPPPNLASVPPLQHRDPGAPPATVSADGKPIKAADYQILLRNHAHQQAADFVSSYGECVVRLDPAKARQLLLTKPETREEAAAFAAMSADFSQCMQRGATVAFSKVMMRGAIALNYYRLAKAAERASGAGAVK
jgi:hypothetical protein